MTRTFVMSVLATLTFCSCTVLEERMPCPGKLTVDVSDLRGRQGAGNLRIDLFAVDGSWSVSRLVEVSDADTMVFIVPKTEYSICASSGQLHTQFSNTGIALGAAGSQADSLFAFSDRLMVEGEETDYRGVFHKNFATVTIVSTIYGGFSGMTLTAKSPFGGLDYRNMTAVENTFNCSIDPDREGRYAFRMYRQADTRMTLVIRAEDFDHIIPVGEQLKQMGYDFDAPDMADVTVGIDIVSMTVAITVAEWNMKRVYAII